MQHTTGRVIGANADERFVALVEREHRGLTAASALIVGNRSTAEEIVRSVTARRTVSATSSSSPRPRSVA